MNRSDVVKGKYFVIWGFEKVHYLDFGVEVAIYYGLLGRIHCRSVCSFLFFSFFPLVVEWKDFYLIFSFFVETFFKFQKLLYYCFSNK